MFAKFPKFRFVYLYGEYFWIQHSGVAELSTRVILGIYSNTDPMNRKSLLMEYLKVTKLSRNSL